jgi:MFS family permease
MGDAFWHPVATGVLVKSMPDRRAQVLGIHAMGGSLGAEILGPISVGFLLGYFPWQTVLQIVVIPAVIMGMVFFWIAPRISVSHGNRISMAAFRKLIRAWSSPQGAAMVTMMVSYNMAFYGMLAMTPVILQQRYGMSPFISSAVFAGMLVLGTLCQPYIGKISDIAGRRKFIVGAILAASLFAFAAGIFVDFSLFIIGLVGAASLFTAVRPVILAAAVEFSGKSESTTLGLVFAILDGVGALGALLAGFAGEINLSLAFILSGVLGLVSITTATMIRFSRDAG